MTSRLLRIVRVLLVCVALASGACALALLALPLLLAGLMLLFDSTAQGLMLLLGRIAGWFGGVLPGGGGALPPYRRLALDPASIALAALPRMAPCLAGLLLTIAAPGRRRTWLFAAASWSVAIMADGWLVALALAPGMAAALLLATGPASPGASASIDASRTRTP